jgi:hypothetical protein
MAEAAGEPGTRLPPREPLLLELLARAAAEDHGGLLERPPLPVECHAGSRMSVRDFILINIKSVRINFIYIFYTLFTEDYLRVSDLIF